ncbi:hypothetical protein J2X04_000014 [Lysobacter niabensis]|jgi:hypothetical protein|uniref:Uncharacterized protein n=1 Tax=Agrilutibacter niabensis TaxID=380628 RepID=A0ABU1VJK1_9GAMM|nr:hypothetical protein [Lysobacter niabensis]MDR7097667.1 hypothetical protein [Lysobacter niabensis]
MSSHDTPWSAQQREWLQALGHEVLMPASAGDGVAAPEPPGDRAGAAPRAAKADVPTKDVPTKDAPTKPEAPLSPLLAALARAADRNPQDSELLAALPDLATLGDVAARRALWPRLRALRRRTP